jgi:hypothetical protein
MCHPSMVFYSLWIVADQAYLRWRGRNVPVRHFWAGVGAATVVLVAPWYGWLIATFGWKLPLQPTSTITEPLPLSFWEYGLTRLKMMITTVLAPSYLVKDLWHGLPGLLVSSGGNQTNVLGKWGNLVLRFYEQTYLAGMTMAVGLTLLLIGWRVRSRGPAHAGRTAVYVWMTLGAISCFLVHLNIVDNQGHAMNLTAPLFILVLCYAGQVLGSLPTWAGRLVLSVAAAEALASRSLIFFVTRNLDRHGLSYIYESTLSWFSGPALLAPALLAAILLLAYLASLHRPRTTGAGPAL